MKCLQSPKISLALIVVLSFAAAECPAGDFNWDCKVNLAELWLADDVAGDLDSDNDIDFGDLQRLTHYWLLDCPYKWPLR